MVPQPRSSSSSSAGAAIVSSRRPTVRNTITEDTLTASFKDVHIDDEQPSDDFDDDPNVWFWSKNSRTLAKEYANLDLRARNIVFSLQDRMSSLPEAVRAAGNMQRSVFKSMIKEATCLEEPHAPDIDIINDIDSELSPSFEFFYTNRLYHGDGVPKPDLDSLPHCNCIGECDPGSCPCITRQRQAIKKIFGIKWDAGCAYDENGRIAVPYRDFPIFECNALCRCDNEYCKNRVRLFKTSVTSISNIVATMQVVQKGRQVKVNIKKTMEKGWGAFGLL